MTKVTIKYSRKINLGNYSSIDLSMMPTITLDDGDDIDDVLRKAWAMCRANVEHAAGPIVEGYKVGELHGITEQELFLGLPVETMGVEEEGDLSYDEYTDEYTYTVNGRHFVGATPDEAHDKAKKEE